MNFPVPWRALFPADAVPILLGRNGTGLREICDATGAQVDISGDGDAPPTLGDKIVTISGAVEQKEAACRRCVDRLREHQEVADQEPGVFVIIVPTSAAPMVVGQKGAQIKEIIELSGSSICVGKDNIKGMADQPIGITGTGGQIVSAVSKINMILQDLADRGRLQPSSFKYRPGAVAQEMAMGGGPYPTQRPTLASSPKTHIKFIVATQVAGWIIGKQGRHIRELQENSGAHIQVLREGEVPPGVPPTDRVVEIGGSFEARADGIQIILLAIDSMPQLQAPRETLLLVPKTLTQPGEIRDFQQMSGAEVEVRDLPGHDESLCTLLGTIEARVKAAQQFLRRLEEVESGSLKTPSAPYERQNREAAPDVQRPSPQEESTKHQEASGSDPWSQRDPWGGGGQTSAHSTADRQPMTSSSRQPVQEAPPKRDEVQPTPAPKAWGQSEPAAPPVEATRTQPWSLNRQPVQEVPLKRDEVQQAPAPWSQPAPAPWSQPAPAPWSQPAPAPPAEATRPQAWPEQRALAQPEPEQLRREEVAVQNMRAFGSLAMDSPLHDGMLGQHDSKLWLLLPADLLQQFLVPHGHLAEIAQKCQIRIDLEAEVPPNMRQVSLTGTVVSNAMAVYHVQERAMLHMSRRWMG